MFDQKPIRHLSLREIGRTLDVVDGDRTYRGIHLANVRTDSALSVAGEILSADVELLDDNGSSIRVTDDAVWWLSEHQN